MDPFTHTAAGVAISRLIPSPSRKWGMLAGVAFALLPDIDFLLVFVDRLSFIRHHRGLTHSFLALGIFAVLGAWAGRRLGGSRWFRPLLLISLAVLASHVLLDVATSYGTQILSPFSRQKFALDWLFIVDPHFTLIVLVGAAGACFAPARGRLLAALSLSLAGMYFLLCGLYHHQALALGRQVFTGRESAIIDVAALPQPFSCRRWHLLGAGSKEVKQTMVQLPLLGFLGLPNSIKSAEAAWTPGINPHAPPLSYQGPRQLVIHAWHGADSPTVDLSPSAEQVLGNYLEFARFPLLFHVSLADSEWVLKWLDLRFAVPGRAFPFVFELSLTPDGGLSHWHFSHGRFQALIP
jgi:inner membrane protein